MPQRSEQTRKAHCRHEYGSGYVQWERVRVAGEERGIRRAGWVLGAEGREGEERNPRVRSTPRNCTLCRNHLLKKSHDHPH
jgi:hypothetical protein